MILILWAISLNLCRIAGLFSTRTDSSLLRVSLEGLSNGSAWFLIKFCLRIFMVLRLVFLNKLARSNSIRPVSVEPFTLGISLSLSSMRLMTANG